jgi:hypothetical protein
MRERDDEFFLVIGVSKVIEKIMKWKKKSEKVLEREG